MKVTVYSWMLFCCSVSLVYIVKVCGVEIITEGTSYRIGFPEELSSKCEFYLIITTVKTTRLYSEGSAVISVPALGVSESKQLSWLAPTVIALRAENFSPTTGSLNNVIHLTTDGTNVTVVGRISCETKSWFKTVYTLGEFLAIPVNFWGRKYVIAESRHDQCGYTVTVLASGQETTVKVNFRVSNFVIGYVEFGGDRISSDTSKSLVIESNGRRDIKSFKADMTGSIVQADQPIGVMLGPIDDDMCFNVGVNILAEQFVPVYAWARRYFVMKNIKQKSNNYENKYRILAAESATVIHFSCSSLSADGTAIFSDEATVDDAGGHFDYSFPGGTEVDLIESSKPILVIMSSKDDDISMAQMVPVLSEWPDQIVHFVSVDAGIAVHLFTRMGCLENLTTTNPNNYNNDNGLPADLVQQPLLGDFVHLNYYVPAGENSWRMLRVQGTDQNCFGITGFVVSNVGEDLEVPASSPIMWGVSCLDDEYFDKDLPGCVPRTTTTEAVPNIGVTTITSTTVSQTSSTSRLDSVIEAALPTTQYNNDVTTESTTSPATVPSNDVTIEETSPTAQHNNDVTTEPTSPTTQPNNDVTTETRSPTAQPNNDVTTETTSPTTQSNNPVTTEATSPTTQANNDVTTGTISPTPQPNNGVTTETTSPTSQPNNDVTTQTTSLTTHRGVVTESTTSTLSPGDNKRFSETLFNLSDTYIAAPGSTLVPEPASDLDNTSEWPKQSGNLNRQTSTVTDHSGPLQVNPRNSGLDTPESNIRLDTTEFNIQPDTTESSIELDTTESSIEPDTTESNIQQDTTESSIQPDNTESNIRPEATESNIQLGATESNIQPDNTLSTIHSDNTESITQPDATESNVQTNSAESNTRRRFVESNMQTDTTEFRMQTDTTTSTTHTDATESNTQPGTTESNIQPYTTESNIQPDTTESNTQPDATESNTQPDATESNIRKDATEATIHPDNTQSNIQPDTTESTIHSDSTESSTHSERTESNIQTNTTESNTQADTIEFNIQTDTIESTIQPVNTESNMQLDTTEPTIHSYTTESNTESDTAESNRRFDTTKSSMRTNSIESNVRPDITEASIQTDITEASIQLGTTEPNTQPDSTESNKHSHISESNIKSGTTEPNMQSYSTESNKRLGTAESNIQPGTTESNLYPGTTEPNIPDHQPHTTSSAFQQSERQTSESTNVQQPNSEDTTTFSNQQLRLETTKSNQASYNTSITQSNPGQPGKEPTREQQTVGYRINNKKVKQCHCPCASKRKETSEEMKIRVHGEVKKTVKELKVEFRNLSRTTRSKTSAQDNRPSTVSFGLSGILILTIVAFLVIAVDSLSVWKILCDR